MSPDDREDLRRKCYQSKADNRASVLVLADAVLELLDADEHRENAERERDEWRAAYERTTDSLIASMDREHMALAQANAAEDRLAVLRAEVGQAVAVARSVTHAHDGVPCSSGLAHLPRAGEGCGAGRCACGSCP